MRTVDFPVRSLSRMGRIYNPGAHVTGWAAVIPQRGNEAKALFDTFLDRFAALQLSGVFMSHERVFLSGFLTEARDQVILFKRVGHDNRAVTAVVTVDLRENERGDLLASWFLFEKDRFAPLWWFFGAVVVFLIGLTLNGSLIFSNNPFDQFAGASILSTFWWLWVVVIGYLIGRGLGMWGRLYKTSPANPYERFDSAVFARYVDVTLKQVFDEARIDAAEIEELRFSDASWIEERRMRRAKE